MEYYPTRPGLPCPFQTLSELDRHWEPKFLPSVHLQMVLLREYPPMLDLEVEVVGYQQRRGMIWPFRLSRLSVVGSEQAANGYQY